MYFEKICVENFHTFDKCEIQLDEFNLIIGKNSSGKSNFLDIFNFISDFSQYGLQNAISLQGGIENLINRSIGEDKNFKINFSVKDVNIFPPLPAPFPREKEDKESTELVIPKLENFDYGFEMAVEDKQIKVINEDIELSYSLFCITPGEKKDAKPINETGKLTVRRNYNDKETSIEYSLELSDSFGYKEEEMENRLIPGAVLEKLRDIEPEDDELLLETASSMIAGPLKELLNHIGVYDISPENVRKGTQETGKRELEPDGSNLAIALRDLCRDKDQKTKFRKLTKDILPFVEDIKVEKSGNKSLFFKLKENFFGSNSNDMTFSPSSMISDGTVNVFSLVLALFFENKEVIGIEEPDKNLHPSLVSKMVSLMKDAATNKQIIATTHNPEVLKHIDLDNLLFIKRNDFSKIIRPKDDETILTFLENDLGIDEIHRENLL